MESNQDLEGNQSGPKQTQKKPSNENNCDNGVLYLTMHHLHYMHDQHGDCYQNGPDAFEVSTYEQKKKKKELLVTKCMIG